MNEGHKQLRKLIKAYARLMNTEKEFSFKAIDRPREAKVTIGDDGLIETVQTWDGESQLFLMSGAKNFTPEYAALSLIKMILYEEEEQQPEREFLIESYESFLDTEEGMRIREPYLKGLKE